MAGRAAMLVNLGTVVMTVLTLASFVEGFGVNWGNIASHPLNPDIVVRMLKENKINKVKLFDADSWTMNALAGSGMEVMVGIPNNLLETLADDYGNAKDWVKENITAYMRKDGVNIKYVAVGNEPFLSAYNGSYLKTTFPALKNIHRALKEAGHTDVMKATIPQNAEVYESANDKPSEGDFRSDVKQIMLDIVKFFHDNDLPFTVNIYPFLSLYLNQHFPVEYAFFDGNGQTIPDNGKNYDNVFDANYDTLVYALNKAGIKDMKIIVGEGQVLSTPTPELFEQEQLALQKWIFLRKIEEMYFRQRSRINWLKEGDQNTTYFFRIVQTRLNFNTIRSFSLSTGVLITDPLEMSSHAITHFQCILGPTVLPLTVPSPPSWFHSLTAFLCSDAQAAQMINIPTPEEIMKILLKLNPNKAPGPDGLTSAFYKASWDFLGTEVVQAIQNFFYTSFMPASTNATILTLVPKHTGASLITDYRPIACLNTIYKVVSRILVRKLKPLLPGIIVPNQTAFVKDRLLVENTSLAGQLVHGYHKSNGQRRITIKVDIAKAFDTLSWDFLFSCLQGLNLPQNYLHWLKACVCTTNFTIGYNGSVNGYFKGTRGLRQGDPLSPYLFVLAMNNLSLMLNKAAREMKFNYHKGCESSRMTHLCFADDLLIFMDGSLESVQAVLQILREFEHRSGLAVSVQKSSFFASGLSVGETELIQFSTGMPLGSLPVRYLGVPLCTKKLTLLNCEGLLQQIKTKFSSWSSKALSFAGRLLLIKTVITGITTFWCSTFILPKACVKRINSLCGVFLWKGDIEEHHTARVAWAEVTKPKTEGGLGIKDLAIWNKACCLKLIWLLFFQAGSVWVAWFREEILQGSVSNLWITKPSQRFSWQVNKILKLSGELFPWIKIRVENGATCRFWTDNWCPLGCLRSLLRSATLGIPNNTTLASLYYNGRWLLPPARSEAQVNLHVYMTTITLTQDEDYYEWEIDGQTSKRYSTGQVYNKLREAGATVPWHDSVWNKRGIPKQSFMTWLIVLDRCPTRDRLLRWGLRTDPSCLLCNSAPECRNHLYFDCSYAWQIWLPLAQRCGLLPQRPWPQVLNQMQALSSRSPLGMLTLLCWQSCMYWIWSERNSRLHRQVGWPTDGHKYATPKLAEKFYAGLMKRLAKDVGTPLRPEKLEVYLFGLLDEDMKSILPGPFERHWGIFRYDGTPKFMLDFTGQGRKIVPVAAKGVQYLDKQWCVVNKDTINLDEVGPDLDYACYHGDCTAMLYGSTCSNLDKIQNISYAFNMFFQIQGQDVRACDFRGSAMITKNNASVGSCLFPIQIVSGSGDFRISYVFGRFIVAGLILLGLVAAI